MSNLEKEIKRAKKFFVFSLFGYTNALFLHIFWKNTAGNLVTNWNPLIGGFDHLQSKLPLSSFIVFFLFSLSTALLINGFYIEYQAKKNEAARKKREQKQKKNQTV